MILITFKTINKGFTNGYLLKIIRKGFALGFALSDKILHFLIHFCNVFFSNHYRIVKLIFQSALPQCY
jgi:hypothetical protein